MRTPGDLAGERLDRVERRHRHVFRRQTADRERHLRALDAFTDDAGHDDFVQSVDVLLQREVLRLASAGDADGPQPRLIADRANAQVELLPAHAGRGNRDGVHALRVGRDGDRQVIDVDIGLIDRLPELGGHLSGDDSRLGLCLCQGRGQGEQHAESHGGGCSSTIHRDHGGHLTP